MPKLEEGLRLQVLEKISALLTAAFGFIAALSWNNSITALFTSVFGTPNALVPDLIYALIVTVIAVVVTLWISKVTAAAKKRLSKSKSK